MISILIGKLIREAIKICLIQHFEADFLWKISLKILNSGLTLKTFTCAYGLVMISKEKYSTSSLLMDFSIQFYTIKVGWSFIYNQGSYVRISNSSWVISNAFLSSADSFLNKLLKIFFQEYYQCVKHFGSRSSLTSCRAWSWSKLFVKVISKQQKLPLAWKEFKCFLKRFTW